MNDQRFNDEDIFNLNKTFDKEDYYVIKNTSKITNLRSRSTSRRRHRNASSSSHSTKVTSEQESSSKRSKKRKKKEKHKSNRHKRKKSKKSKVERYSSPESANDSNKDSDDSNQNDRKSVKSQISLIREKSNSSEKNADFSDDQGLSYRSKSSSRHRDRSRRKSSFDEKYERYHETDKRNYSSRDNKNYSNYDGLERNTAKRERRKYSDDIISDNQYISYHRMVYHKDSSEKTYLEYKEDSYYRRQNRHDKSYNFGNNFSPNAVSSAPYKDNNYYSEAKFEMTRMSPSTVIYPPPTVPIPYAVPAHTNRNQYQNNSRAYQLNKYPDRFNNYSRWPVNSKTFHRYQENNLRHDYHESRSSNLKKSKSIADSLNEPVFEEHSFSDATISQDRLKIDADDLSSNQNDENDKPELLKQKSASNVINESTQEDLLALKNDIQKQLKEKLFDCEKFMNLFEIAGFDGESETDKDVSKPDEKLRHNGSSRKNKENKKRRRSNSNTDKMTSSPEQSPLRLDIEKITEQKNSPGLKIKSKTNKKIPKVKTKRLSSKTSSKKSKLKKIKSNDINLSELFLEDELGDIVRRSDRIKTIEVIKQHHNELKIAEKIKQHINHHPGTPSDENQREISFNSPEFPYDQPISLKLKERRVSELSEAFMQTPNASFSPQQINIFPNSDLEFSNKAVLIHRNNSLYNSPNSNSPVSLNTDSPKGFKKNLLSKTVNEAIQIQKIGDSFKNTINEIQNYVPLTENVDKTYERIEDNIYLCKRVKQNKFSREAKKMVCDCSTSHKEQSLGIPACGDDCLNRLLMIECGSRCPCGDYCTNKNFETKNNAPVQPFRTEMKGWGLKTLTDLKTNTFLLEYVGEIIDLREFKKRSEKYAAQNNEHFYFMSLHNELFIDATQKGNISRYFNHSCDPNCETQKWTVNGELRIGFFTRRPVSAHEELTFDYQFQTVGKKQQKCYCGSEKCRGFLGAPSNNSQSSGNISNGALDHIWERSSEESPDDQITSEDNSDAEENNLRIKNSKRSRTLSDAEFSTASNVNRVSEIKTKKEKKIKKAELKDYDLNDQINSIKNLTNKESVLKLCRLMFRTESLESRIDILNLLLNAKSEISLRLFMDYYGLKLLCIWMCDIDSPGRLSVLLIECKIKIIQVLAKMAIKNRTVLEEFKLLSIVKRWSEHSPVLDSPITLNLKYEKSDVIHSIMNKLVDHVAEVSVNQENKLIDMLNDESSKLYEVWNGLKVDFKIPKKQRIEERKEHERELNMAYSNTVQAITTTQKANFEKFSRENVYKKNKIDQALHNERLFSKNCYQKFPSFNSNQNSPSQYQQPQQLIYQVKNPNQNMGLSKEQRRLLFEQRVREQEQAEAAAMVNTASQSNELRDHNQKMRWFFNTNLNQWILIPDTTTDNVILTQHYAQTDSVNFTKENHPDILDRAFSSSFKNSNSADNEQLNDLQKPVDKLADIHKPAEEVKESLESRIRKYLLAGAVSPTSSNLLIKSGLSPTLDNKQSISSSSITNGGNSQKPVADLSKYWKKKINEKGLTYYYNIKTQKSQWNFPTSEILVASNSAKSEVLVANDSSESLKVYKDQFRDKLSKLVVNLLKPYLGENCKVGRIKNIEDFKHLARKFTHTIIEKEMSKTSKLEELELDKRVKMKSAEYVKNYMAKFNISGYSRKQDV